jgi:hypothetical protein
MDINQKVFYGENLYDFEAYLDRLIAKAMEPYAFQLQERWKASIIKEKVERIFFDFWNGNIPENGMGNERRSFQGDGRGTGAWAAQAICRVISEEVYQHFLESGKRPFYVIDFMVFNKDIENELQKIRSIN